ncbi:C2H2-type zinc finger protein [Endozoicomonas lisbonensis]|uniref:C2H2-type domain-containing protein n=1 Tax=Endozoicomonas lisbonensis TaxID=3120522 RepID=A0ABV2SI02_9GAMM
MGRPYQCDLCQLGFTRKADYEGHMKRKHKSPTPVSVQSQVEPVGIVTTTSLQTVAACGNSTTVSTIVSPEGSAYLVTSCTTATTTTMVPLPAEGMATATTNNGTLLAGRDSGVSNEATSGWGLPVLDVSEEDFL